LPYWVYAALGGAALTVLIAVAVVIRSFGGSSANRFPDPAVDVALGVAAQAAIQPAQPLRAPIAATPALAVVNSSVTPPTARVADRPPPTMPSTVAAQTALAPTAPAPSVTNAPLTTAQIVARWEPSVALVKGQASSGTGFIVKPGIVVTNAHVIDDEFISGLEVRFPSAPAGKQGPLAAELLYEDPKRDLAFLAVSTDLPATEIAPNYSFVKGEDITVIGNPGLGDEVVLENAISRGVMSSKTVIDGMNYLQLSMSINPGNSGGPVFDSGGRVIGVATLKAAKAEALAFCIPVEELQSAVTQVGSARPDLVSRHRAQVGFKLLTVAGAIYGIGLDIRAGLMRKAPAGAKANLLPNEPIQKLDETLTTLDEKLFSLVDGEMPQIKADSALAPKTRTRYQDLSAGYKAMKDLYANTNRPADQYASQVQSLRTKYVGLVESLQKDLKIDVPPQLLAMLKARVVDDQSTALVNQIVPGHVQSRILRGRGGLSQRGAIGPRTPAASSPAQSARDRMQDLRDRAQSITQEQLRRPNHG